MVGFTRIIRLSWLNKTLELAAEGLDASQMRDELEKYLSFEIKSDTNRRKTREILLLPWVPRMMLWLLCGQKRLSLRRVIPTSCCRCTGDC